MTQPIVYVDKSTARDGKLEELKAAMKHLAAFVEANAPQVMSYAFFLNSDQTLMTVVAVHPDSASLEFHMDVGTEEFRKFGELIDLIQIEIYGRVSDEVLDRLRAKARMLGSGTVEIHDLEAGFARRPG
jgi:uncharacterized protein YkuJ